MAQAETTGGAITETVKTIVYALLIAGVFRTIFFQPFWIPSGSMKDTLLIGDFLFVNKMAYGYSSYSCEIPVIGVSACPFVKGRWLGSEPERGDVVVFKNPITGVDFIKRLTGMPGDRIQMKDGVLYINDVPAPQEPAGDFVETFERQGPVGSLPMCANAGVGLGGDCIKERYRETLPDGTVHDILNVRPGPLDNTSVYTVPEGHFFFMGDNRDNSNDSRVMPPNGFGFVPFENLIGRADRIMFSSAGRSLFFVWTWRGDRFFKKIE